MKCQECDRPAVFHITEIPAEGQIEELHLCEACAARYLSEPIPGTQGPSNVGGSVIDVELSQQMEQLRCPECHVSLKDFRDTGRLGCPHDYEFFREQLQPLLQSIHGEDQHTGKVPRRAGERETIRQELARLRRQMQELIHAERYEEAAQVRDRIRELEARDDS